MRLVFLATLMASGGANFTFGQSTNSAPYPKIEVFSGFSANKFFYSESAGEAANPNPNAASFFDFGADRHKGLDISIARNLSRYFGVKADYSMYFSEDSGKTVDGLDFRVPERAINFMMGPEIKAHNHTRLTPFAHALFGVAYSRAALTIDESGSAPNLTLTQSHNRSGFAMALGGGVDLRLTRRVSIRTMTDYTATHLGNPSPDDGGRQNNIRFALGFLFQLR